MYLDARLRGAETHLLTSLDVNANRVIEDRVEGSNPHFWIQLKLGGRGIVNCLA